MAQIKEQKSRLVRERVVRRFIHIAVLNVSTLKL